MYDKWCSERSWILMKKFLAKNNENGDCLGSATVRKHFISCSNYLKFI